VNLSTREEKELTKKVILLIQKLVIFLKKRKVARFSAARSLMNAVNCHLLSTWSVITSMVMTSEDTLIVTPRPAKKS
jgi:hypothetical protein